MCARNRMARTSPHTLLAGWQVAHCQLWTCEQKHNYNFPTSPALKSSGADPWAVALGGSDSILSRANGPFNIWKLPPCVRVPVCWTLVTTEKKNVKKNNKKKNCYGYCYFSVNAPQQVETLLAWAPCTSDVWWDVPAQTNLQLSWPHVNFSFSHYKYL